MNKITNRIEALNAIKEMYDNYNFCSRYFRENLDEVFARFSDELFKDDQLFIELVDIAPSLLSKADASVKANKQVILAALRAPLSLLILDEIKTDLLKDADIAKALIEIDEYNYYYTLAERAKQVKYKVMNAFEERKHKEDVARYEKDGFASFRL